MAANKQIKSPVDEDVESSIASLSASVVSDEQLADTNASMYWLKSLDKGKLHHGLCNKARLYSHHRAFRTSKLPKAFSESENDTTGTKRSLLLNTKTRNAEDKQQQKQIQTPSPATAAADEIDNTSLIQHPICHLLADLVAVNYKSPVIVEYSLPPKDNQEVETLAFTVDEFFNFLSSKEWRESTNLRVIGGHLLPLLIHSLNYLERIGEIRGVPSLAYLNNEFWVTQQQQEEQQTDAVEENNIGGEASNRSSGENLFADESQTETKNSTKIHGHDIWNPEKVLVKTIFFYPFEVTERQKNKRRSTGMSLEGGSLYMYRKPDPVRASRLYRVNKLLLNPKDIFDPQLKIERLEKEMDVCKKRFKQEHQQLQEQQGGKQGKGGKGAEEKGGNAKGGDSDSKAKGPPKDSEIEDIEEYPVIFGEDNPQDKSSKNTATDKQSFGVGVGKFHENKGMIESQAASSFEGISSKSEEERSQPSTNASQDVIPQDENNLEKKKSKVGSLTDSQYSMTKSIVTIKEDAEHIPVSEYYERRDSTSLTKTSTSSSIFDTDIDHTDFKRLDLFDDTLHVTGLYLPANNNRRSASDRLAEANRNRLRQRHVKANNALNSIKASLDFDLDDRFKSLIQERNKAWWRAERIKMNLKPFPKSEKPDYRSDDQKAWDNYFQEQMAMEMRVATHSEMENRFLKSLSEIKRMKRLGLPIPGEDISNADKKGKVNKPNTNKNAIESVKFSDEVLVFNDGTNSSRLPVSQARYKNMIRPGDQNKPKPVSILKKHGNNNAKSSARDHPLRKAESPRSSEDTTSTDKLPPITVAQDKSKESKVNVPNKKSRGTMHPLQSYANNIIKKYSTSKNQFFTSTSGRSNQCLQSPERRGSKLYRDSRRVSGDVATGTSVRNSKTLEVSSSPERRGVRSLEDLPLDNICACPDCADDCVLDEELAYLKPKIIGGSFVYPAQLGRIPKRTAAGKVNTDGDLDLDGDESNRERFPWVDIIDEEDDDNDDDNDGNKESSRDNEHNVTSQTNNNDLTSFQERNTVFENVRSQMLDVLKKVIVCKEIISSSVGNTFTTITFSRGDNILPN